MYNASQVVSVYWKYISTVLGELNWRVLAIGCEHCVVMMNLIAADIHFQCLAIPNVISPCALS